MDVNNFFDAVRLARAKTFITQDKDNGYSLHAEVSHQGEDDQPTKETISLTTKQVVDDTAEKKEYVHVPKMFKSMDSVIDLLRKNKIVDFRVKIDSMDIKQNTRTKKA